MNQRDKGQHEQRQVALVTGASSGIGADFCRELARRGFDLVIAARRSALLQELASELSSDHGIAVHTVENDLDDPRGARQLYDRVRALELPVWLLVNNAGLGRYGPLVEQSLADIETMIQVNLASLTRLTRLLAEDMVAHGGGRILNNASFAALQPVPGYTVYSATKAYVAALSQALDHELRPRGVTVSALCPGFFESDFFTHAGQQPNGYMRMMLLKRQRVARAGIAGALKGRTTIVPGLFYKLGALLNRILPRRTASGLSQFVVKS